MSVYFKSEEIMIEELCEACKTDDINKVKALVEANHNIVNQYDHNLDCPSMRAAQNGAFNSLKYLFTQGAKTAYGLYPAINLLSWACECKDMAKKEKILNDLYSNFEQYPFEDGTTQLHVAAALGNLEDCQNQKEALLKPNQKGVTPYFCITNATRRNNKID